MVVCHINAALDRNAGLCSPVGLRDLLAQSFNHADQLLLEELKGGRLHLMAPSWHVPVQSHDAPAWWSEHCESTVVMHSLQGWTMRMSGWRAPQRRWPWCGATRSSSPMWATAAQCCAETAGMWTSPPSTGDLLPTLLCDTAQYASRTSCAASTKHIGHGSSHSTWGRSQDYRLWTPIGGDTTTRVS